MKSLLGIGLALVLPVVIQAAEPPEICGQSNVPRREQRPFEDLSGRLPVADYLEAVLDCSGFARSGALSRSPFARSPIPESPWLEAESQRYSELLSKRKHPWLVLPVQIQYLGFDYAERALLSAEIAAAFADQGSSPEIHLTARALGQVRRRYERSAMDKLTLAVGAQRRVETYVGHDGAHGLTLTIQLKECAPAPSGTCRLIKQHDWRKLPFTDEMPPFRVVNRLRDEIRRTMLENGAPPRPAAPPQAPDFRGLTPAQVFALRPSPTVHSLLASFASKHDEFSRYRVHAVALRAWLDAPRTAESRFHAAYSALMLDRRPFGLELIKGQADPASNALREFLNGNYPEAVQKTALVKSPVQKLYLEFLAQDLANAYGREREFTASVATDVFGAAAPAWRGLVDRRVNDGSSWLRGDPETIKVLLDALAPIKGLGIIESRVGAEVAGRRQSTDAVNLRHLRQAATLLADDATKWQAYHVLENLAQSDAFWSVVQTVQMRGAPEAGMARVRDLEGSFAGHPVFEGARAMVLGKLAARAPNDEQQRFVDAYERAEMSAGYWFQGAQQFSEWLLFRGTHTLPLADAFGRDFPPRERWPHEIEDYAVGAGPCASLAYAVVYNGDSRQCLRSLPQPAAEKLRTELRGRFHGSPSQDVEGATAAPLNPEEDPVDRMVATILAATKSDPDTWSNYERAGTLLILHRGKYAEAQKVYLSYPLFRSRATRRVVELSNAAYESGSELYWKGQPDLARPLYQIAADLDTGSAASLSSAARLAQLDGHYEEAASIFQARAARYDDAYAYRDYLSLLYVMGHAEQADAAFTQIAEALRGPQAWVSQLVGQRMSGMTPEQFRRWITSPEIIGARNRGQFFAGYFTMIAATTDRSPDAHTVSLLKEVTRADTRRLNEARLVEKPHTLVPGTETVQPSSFPAARARGPVEPSEVEHEYVLLSQALAALQKQQYKSAYDVFMRYARLYSIEYGNTRTALPYFALAAAKVGDPSKLEDYIQTLPAGDVEFDFLLARTFFAAARKDVKTAESLLQRAFNFRPHTDGRPVLSEYQYAEACEIVGRETGDPRFVRMMVEWARQNQRIQPTQAWSYAVEAQYSTNPAEASRALAMALYLDPLSPRLTGIGEARKSAARDWLKANNPFIRKKIPMARPVT